MRDWNDHHDDAQPTSWALKLEAVVVGASMLFGLGAVLWSLF